MPAKSIWLEWHVVLSEKPENALQIGFILDLIKPVIDELGDSVDLFHFFRYKKAFSQIENQFGSGEGFDELRPLGWTTVSYVTLRVRTWDDRVADVWDLIKERLHSYTPKVYPVYCGEESADVRKGLATYGGDQVHPLQHVYFDSISRISIALLEKARNGELNTSGSVCGTEQVASQWSHMVLNQLGVIEQPLTAPDGKRIVVALPNGTHQYALCYAPLFE